MSSSGKNSNSKSLPGSNFLSIRRKSVPKNVASKERVSPAGQASMLGAEREGVHKALTRAAPRPRSSWYSQLSISEEAIAAPPVAVPRVPDQYLKTLAAQIPENGRPYTPIVLPAPSRSDSSDSWEDESPGGTRQSSRGSHTNRKHTAVSEYLRDRSWQAKTPRNATPGAFIEEYPELTSSPPPIPSNRPLSMLRRFSVRRNSRRNSNISKLDQEEPVEHPRRESVFQQASRRASSVKTTWPYSMLAKLQSQPESPVSPVSYVSTPQLLDPRIPRTPHTLSTEPFAATPYHTTRPGPAPTPIKSLHYQIPSENLPADPNSTSKRGLTKHYGKELARRISLTSTTLSSNFALPSYHTSQHEGLRIPYPVTSGSRLLTGGNSEAREYSYQGYWLFIGTMRGPTPSGVKIIDEIMGKSLSKKGNTDKGVKEIRKVLRHEKRTVIEWVENYVRRKWGVEV